MAGEVERSRVRGRKKEPPLELGEGPVSDEVGVLRPQLVCCNVFL